MSCRLTVEHWYAHLTISIAEIVPRDGIKFTNDYHYILQAAPDTRIDMRGINLKPLCNLPEKKKLVKLFFAQLLKL